MKILKLKLRGAIGIRKGLGLEEIEIDFAQFNSGIIALTGKNGGGKTTILENLHPFRQMVSREGSLQSHFYLKDSYRILTFEQDGCIYESKILIDALTGASEAYLIKDGKPLTDGKLGTYDEAIEKVLGSADLFFNSVFSGQRSKGIAELKPAERRKLFYELLNLDVYEQYLAKAKEELRTNETKLAEIEGEIKALSADQTSVDILEDQRKTLLNDQANIITRMTDLEIEKDNLNKSVQEIKVKLQLAEERQLQQKDIDNKIFSLTESIDQLTKEHNSKIIRYNSEIEQSKKLIDRNKKLLENSGKIQEALKRKSQVQGQVDAAKETGNQLQRDYSELQKVYSDKLKELVAQENHVNELRTKSNNLINAVKQCNEEILRIENETKLIKEVPCDEQTGSSCKFLINAYIGKSNLENLYGSRNLILADGDTLEKELHEAESKLRTDKQVIDENYQLNSKTVSDKLDENKNHILKLTAEIKNIDAGNWEKLNNELKNAETEIKMLEQSVTGSENLKIEATSNYQANITRIGAEIEDLKKKIDVKLFNRINELIAELASFEDDLAGNKLALIMLSKDLDKSNSDVANTEAQIEQIKKNEERIKKLNQDKAGVENEIRDWTFLTKAFDKTGIPVLKLENSGIEITTIANELLSIFENKFRIVFETTRLKADKKSFKESFDINVVEEEGVTELSNKSGGERVWIETALRLAVSLVVRQQGKNIQTSFADEVDGALDLNNAHLFLEMLRSAHNKSGVHNTFFITHRPELIDLIPQRIKLEDGYLQLNVN
jgi:exonuclease SbcC